MLTPIDLTILERIASRSVTQKDLVLMHVTGSSSIVFSAESTEFIYTKEVTSGFSINFEGKGIFGVPIKPLKAFLRSKSDVELVLKENSILLRNDSNTLQLFYVDAIDSEPKKVLKRPKDAWRLSNLSAYWVYIGSLVNLEANTPIPVLVHLSDTGTEIIAGDNHHCVFIETSNRQKKGELCFNSNLFSLIQEFAYVKVEENVANLFLPDGDATLTLLKMTSNEISKDDILILLSNHYDKAFRGKPSFKKFVNEAKQVSPSNARLEFIERSGTLKLVCQNETLKYEVDTGIKIAKGMHFKCLLSHLCNSLLPGLEHPFEVSVSANVIKIEFEEPVKRTIFLNRL